MQEASRRPTPIAAALAVLGGALLVIGSFLAWAEVSGGGTSVIADGVDGTDGWITLVAGTIMLLAGVLLIGSAARRVIAIFAIVAGLVGGGVGLYDALTAQDRVLDGAAEELGPQVGAAPEQVRELLDQAMDAGQIGISISIGLYMVIAGGALGIVGGVLGTRSRAPATPLPAAVPAASGPTEPAPRTDPSAPSELAPPGDLPEPPPPAPGTGDPP